MAVADRHGLPVAICVESATPHEVKLATNTLVQMVIPDAPQNLVGDNAYDSDKLDSELRRYGIELIAPHRMNRKNTTQDLRRLRRTRLVYVTPGHQFPLGITMSLARRLELLKWANRSGSLIFEDDYDGEFRYSGRPIPALQGLDHSGCVLYAGSFSKILFSVSPLRLSGCPC